MIRASALYPHSDGARFDHEYYETHHRQMVLDQLGPMGLVRVEMDRGVGGLEGPPPPFVAVGHLYFETLAELEDALGAHGEEIMEDLPNFTDIEPMIQVSQVSRR